MESQEQRPKVSIIKCDTYEPAMVEKAIRASLDNLGGISEFVKPGEKVLIKINLLSASKPEEVITTHPTVIRSVVHILEEVGCQVIVGDSPGGPSSKGRLERAYKKAGVVQALEGTNAKLYLGLEGTRTPCPDGKLIKSFEILDVFNEVDKIITLPKLKTHMLTGFTGATKICYGLIPGMVKATYHSTLPDPEDFSDMLLDLTELIDPDLAIMDGIIGMEGKGPAAGDPKTAGAIIASSDSPALDIVASNLVDLDPFEIMILRTAVKRKLTTGKLEDINIIGEDLASFSDIKFEPAVRTKRRRFRIPRPIRRFLVKRYISKPLPVKGRCTGCSDCMRACPRECIQIIDKLAVMEYDKCIRCFCCHELCPERAIDII